MLFFFLIFFFLYNKTRQHTTATVIWTILYCHLWIISNVKLHIFNCSSKCGYCFPLMNSQAMLVGVITKIHKVGLCILVMQAYIYMKICPFLFWFGSLNNLQVSIILLNSTFISSISVTLVQFSSYYNPKFYSFRYVGF